MLDYMLSNVRSLQVNLVAESNKRMCRLGWHAFRVQEGSLLHCAYETVCSHVISHVSFSKPKVSDFDMPIGIQQDILLHMVRVSNLNTILFA